MSRRETFAHLCTSFRLLFFRCFVRGAALASILVVVVCLQVSCMVPQTIDAIVESPHPAPHIVLESIQPYLLARVLTLYQQGSTDLAASPQCHCRLEFDSLSVQEQDSTVTLEARWFIDYDTANIPSTRIAFSEQIAPHVRIRRRGRWNREQRRARGGSRHRRDDRIRPRLHHAPQSRDEAGLHGQHVQVRGGRPSRTVLRPM